MANAKKLNKDGSVNRRASENHPWKKKMQADFAKHDAKKQQVTKTETKRPAWQCPSCGSSTCEFGECVDEVSYG